MSKKKKGRAKEDIELMIHSDHRTEVSWAGLRIKKGAEFKIEHAMEHGYRVSLSEINGIEILVFLPTRLVEEI